MRSLALFCCLSIALLCVYASSLQAAVFNIPNGDVTALKNAIYTANTNGEEDTIELAANGAYMLTSVEPNGTGGLTGLPHIGADGGKSLTIHGNGAMIQRTLPGGTQPQFRIFYLDVGATATISGLTISNGFAGGSTFPQNAGAAIFNDRGALTVASCIISGNSANGGGAGIFNFSSTIGASLIVSDTLFVNNTSLFGGFGDGGGIYNYGFSTSGNATLSIVHCTFSANTADFGGGVLSTGSAGHATTTVTDSTFEGNSGTYGSGGAIYNFGRNNGMASLNVTNSTFKANSTPYYGGAIHNRGNQGSASLVMSSCTLSGNSADSQGGGIYNYSTNSGAATATITNSTLDGNSASAAGGAIYNQSDPSPATISLKNAILKTGTSGENIYNVGGAITSQGYNLSDDSGGGFLTAPADQINTDPMLDPAGLQNKGGPTQTIALLAGSPAINTGDPNAPTRDQRYYLRNGGPDRGAFEYGGTISPLSVVSRKMHGAAGTFDVDLPLDGNTGVECRSGGVGGNHQLIMTFATPVTIGSASVTTGTGSVSNTSISGSRVTLDLTGVANAQQIVLTVSGVNDGANTNSVIIPMRVLLADTTGNSTVNASDVSQTKSQVGQAVTSSNFRTDINVSGTISASDVSAVKSKVGTVVPIAGD